MNADRTDTSRNVKGDFVHVSMEVRFLIASKGDPRDAITRGYTHRGMANPYFFLEHPFHIDFDETLIPFLLLSGAIEWDIRPPVPIQRGNFKPHSRFKLKIDADFQLPIHDFRTLQPISTTPKDYLQSFLESWENIQNYSIDVQILPTITKLSLIQLHGHVFFHPLSRYWAMIDEDGQIDILRRDFIQFFQETGAVDYKWVDVEQVSPTQEQLDFLVDQPEFEECYSEYPDRYWWLRISFEAVFRERSLVKPFDRFLTNALSQKFGDDICFPSIEVVPLMKVQGIGQFYHPLIRQVDLKMLQLEPYPPEQWEEQSPNRKELELFLFRSNFWGTRINFRKITDKRKIQETQQRTEIFPQTYREFEEYVEKIVPDGVMNHIWEVTVSTFFLKDHVYDWAYWSSIPEVEKYLLDFCSEFVPCSSSAEGWGEGFIFFDYCISSLDHQRVISLHDRLINAKPSNKYDARLWYAKARSLEMFGRHKAAIKAYDTAARNWELANQIASRSGIKCLGSLDELYEIFYKGFHELHLSEKDKTLIEKLRKQGWT